MRTIWLMVSTMAIANLLALAGFAGWLAASGRLSRERLHAMREVFALTIVEQHAHEEEERAALELQAKAEAEQARVGLAPMTSEHQIKLAESVTEVAQRRHARMQREANDLRDSIASERAELDRRRAEFERRVEEFEARRNEILAEEGSRQFQKAVELYRSLKPPIARAMMASLVREGEIDVVVSYLNALPTRTSAKIVAEFQKEDAALAAELLERIREQGTAFEFAGVTTGVEDQQP